MTEPPDPTALTSLQELKLDRAFAHLDVAPAAPASVLEASASALAGAASALVGAGSALRSRS